MTTKKLIIIVIGIFIIFTSLYYMISPITTRTLEKSFEEEFSLEGNKQDVDDEDEIVGENQQVPVTTSTQNTTSNTSTTANTVTNTTNQEKTYTASEVATHASASSCWSIIDGFVYDLTSYVSKHPGGERNILRICGTDGSSEFEGQHGGETRPENILANYKIGSLK